MIKVNATARLHAVTVLPMVYTDSDGAHDLKVIQRLFARQHTLVGRNKEGVEFYWAGPGRRFLVCVDREQIVGFIGLRRGFEQVDVGGREISARSINSTYLKKAYRSRGLILGMHQYLISQFNLLSDDVYTPDGFRVWQTLQKLGHKVQCISISREADPNDWQDDDTLLLIMKGQ